MSIDYRSLAKSLIQEFTGDRNVISIPRKFIDLTGDLNSAALLNQILYWSSRTKDPDGWFFKTYPEWEKEIGLTQYQIKRAVAGDKRSKDRLTLSDLGVQTIRKKHGNAVKLHYRVDMDVFFTQFDNFLNMNNVDNQQCEQSMNMNNVDNPYTETTAETTEKLIASPHGNAERHHVTVTKPKWFDSVVEMILSWEKGPITRSDCQDYVNQLVSENCHMAVWDEQEVLGYISDNYVKFWTKPTTPQLPKAVEDKFMQVVEEVREERAKKERKPNLWYDAVKDTMGAEGFKNGNIVNTLLGRGKKDYAKYDLETPLTDPEQVHIFWAWYQSICPGCSLVSPATVQDYVMRWQREGMPDVRVKVYDPRKDPAEPRTVFDLMAD